MSILVGAVLAIGVACAWLGALAFLRLSSLSRIHAVAFVNVAAGGAFMLSTWLSDGVTSRSGKVLLIWLVLVYSGALASHVTGRAIHLRGGERR